MLINIRRSYYKVLQELCRFCLGVSIALLKCELRQTELKYFGIIFSIKQTFNLLHTFYSSQLLMVIWSVYCIHRDCGVGKVWLNPHKNLKVWRASHFQFASSSLASALAIAEQIVRYRLLKWCCWLQSLKEMLISLQVLGCNSHFTLELTRQANQANWQYLAACYTCCQTKIFNR